MIFLRKCPVGAGQGADRGVKLVGDVVCSIFLLRSLYYAFRQEEQPASRQR